MKYVRYNGQPVEIGRIGAGHCDLQPITIATVQSAEVALADKFTPYDADSKKDKTKLSDNQKKEVIRFLKEAQFVTVDECQHCSCQTIQTVMGQSYKARLRIGCSASPWRDDGLDILIEACFGKRLCDIDASFLIDNGYLIQPYIIFNHFKLDYGENDNFNGLPKKQFTMSPKIDQRLFWLNGLLMPIR
jgi:superfamily II DNA or RNA helicase